jgi:tetratricopeptide (TPR) repeat protein
MFVPPLARVMLLGALLCAALARPAAAASPDARTRAARAHFESGVAHYNLDEFAAALSEFTEAYRLKPDPSFLFNIAQCHRRLGEADAAVDFYRKYLRNFPDPPNRADVERLIADLRARKTDQDAAASPAPAPTPTLAPAPPPPAPTPAAAPTLAPATPPPAAPPTLGPIASPAPAAETAPVYRRWWFWTAIGVVAAGAATAAVLASHGGEGPYVGSLGTTPVPSN